MNYSHSASDIDAVDAAWTLDFATAIDPSCSTEDSPYSESDYVGPASDTADAGAGGNPCTACPAARALQGQCPPGQYTIMTDLTGPEGLKSITSVAIVIDIGAAVVSGDVLVRFEVVSDTEGVEGAAQAAARLQQMLILTQVC